MNLQIFLTIPSLVSTFAFSAFFFTVLTSSTAQAERVQSTQEFCLSEALNGRTSGPAVYINPSDPHELVPLELDNRSEKITSHLGSTADAWELAMVPIESVRLTGYNLSLYNKDAGDLISRKALQAELEKPTGRKLSGLSPLSLFELSSSDEKEISQGALQRGFLCGKYGLNPISIIICTNELDRMLKRFSPKSIGTTKLTGVPYLVTFLQNPIHAEVLPGVALKMMDAVKTAKTSRTVQGDLLNDLTEAYFKKTGQHESAVNLAYEVLTVFGIRGQNVNLLNHFASDRMQIAIYAMRIIFSGAAYLDSVALKSRTRGAFSFPSSVSNTCDTGKSYHFWLPAIISREVSSRTGNPSIGAAVAHILSLGYQMRGNVMYRDANRPFTVNSFETGNQKIRMDLAYASAGSMFGANDNRKGISVDSILTQILRESAELPAVSREKATQLWSGTGFEGFARWVRIFAPWAGMNP